MEQQSLRGRDVQDLQDASNFKVLNNHKKQSLRTILTPTCCFSWMLPLLMLDASVSVRKQTTHIIANLSSQTNKEVQLQEASS